MSFHTHDPHFVGTHTHQLDGAKVKHRHVDQGSGEDVLHVVEIDDRRFKKPKAPATGPHAELEVQNVKGSSTGKQVH